MSEEYGNDFITLTDEDGTEIELEHLDTIEYEDETYMLFGLTEEAEEEDEIAVIIMRTVMNDGEELLEEVQDEILLDEVYAIFMKRIEEEDGEE